MTKKYLEALKWRYATKRFSEKTISDEDLDFLKESIQYTASSFGLQPYEVLIINDKSIKRELSDAALKQPQVMECSHLFVFCSKLKVTESDINVYMNKISYTRKVSLDVLEGFKKGLKNHISKRNIGNQFAWTEKQAYIALGNLLSACAISEIDACPMESFNTKSINKILNLKKTGYSASVLVAVGYRSENDQYQYLAKVRKDTNELFKII